jgi:hypothetical protein
LTPASAATPSAPALQSTEERINCSACGPHSLVPNSNTPSCAKYEPDPIADIAARWPQRRQPRHIVTGRQHAYVGAVFVLHHLADADRDV